MAQYPKDLRYTKDHEWARRDGELVRIGITAYAVEQLGDVTLVDLPPIGGEVRAGERFGDIESVKTVSELFSPVSGVIVEVNDGIEGSPETVNESQYDKGWLVAVRASDLAEIDKLMDAAAYEAHLAKLDH
jgi:glycine cleavage system H protein